MIAGGYEFATLMCDRKPFSTRWIHLSAVCLGHRNRVPETLDSFSTVLSMSFIC